MNGKLCCISLYPQNLSFKAKAGVAQVLLSLRPDRLSCGNSLIACHYEEVFSPCPRKRRLI